MVDLSTLRLDTETETSLSTSVESLVNEYLAVKENDRTSTHSKEDSDESEADASGIETSVEVQGDKIENADEDEKCSASILTFECARDEAKALAQLLIDLVKGSRGELKVK